MQGILSYTEVDSVLPLWQGLLLVLALLVTELVRASTFTLIWTINSHTGTLSYPLIFTSILIVTYLTSCVDIADQILVIKT